MAKELAIVLNNGSINSAVTTALAAQRYRIVMLFIDHGQGHGARARMAFDQQVVQFKPFREHVLEMPFLADLEQNHEAVAADPRHPVPVTPRLVELLPLVGTAMAYAVHYQATSLHMGLRLGPDAEELARTTEYGQVWEELMQLPCSQPDLKIEMPLLELEPWKVIDLGFQVAVAFEKTWTCIESGTDPCWACRACRNRESAFQRAAKADPMRVVRKV